MTEFASNSTPTDAEIASAAEVLSRFEQGRLPLPLFMQIARLATLSTVELVPIRDRGTELEVLLTPRPLNDPWEGQWHVPGTVILPTDPLDHAHDYSAPFARLIGPDSELGRDIEVVADPVLVDVERRKSLRGDELSAIHYVKVEGESDNGRFFNVEEFPGNVPAPGAIDHHVGLVERTVAAYLRSKKE